MPAWKPGRNTTEPAADCCYGPVREMRQKRSREHGDNAGRHAFADSWPQINGRHRQRADRERIPVHPRKMAAERTNLLRNVRGHFQSEPEEFVELSAENNH